MVKCEEAVRGGCLFFLVTFGICIIYIPFVTFFRDYLKPLAVFLNKLPYNMVKIVLYLLKNVPVRSRNLDAARGRYKYPENWREFVRYLKFRYG